MKMLLLAILFNLIAFAILLLMMPDISAVAFLVFVLLIPFVFNSLLYMYMKKTKIKNDWIKISVLSAITGLFYAFFGYYAEHLDKINGFVVRNVYENETIHINIDSNIASISNIIFVVLSQFCVLYIVRMIINKEKS